MNGASGVMIASIISGLVHVGAGGGAYWWMNREAKPIVAELDLSMVPMIAMPANKGGGYGKAPENWISAKKGKKAPVPIAVVEKPQTKEEVVKEENQGTPCTGECPETTAGPGWGGGTGEGDGQYVPETELANRPRWIRNFITSADYPLIARQEGRDGRVVLSVLIDDTGRVRDVRLLQGSYEALNEVALRKVKNAVFSPARDHNKKAVSCKVTLPIRFELR